MSTATIPFQFRNGFLPDSAGGSVGVYFNYVDLTSIDGDNGLREAARIWWALERIKMTPSGTVTMGSDSITFEHEYQAPDALDTSASDFYYVSQSGSICASSSSIGSTTTKEPAFRSAKTYSNDLIPCDFIQGFDTRTTPYYRYEYCRFKFYVYFTGTKWRLYYQFSFYVTSSQSSYFSQLGICNPAINLGSIIADSTIYASGSFLLFGYTINWNAGYYSDYPSSIFSGAGLSCTTTEWTF